MNYQKLKSKFFNYSHCSNLLFCCYDEISVERVYLAYTCRSQSIIELSQGRNSSKNSSRNHEKMLITGLLICFTQLAVLCMAQDYLPR